MNMYTNFVVSTFPTYQYIIHTSELYSFIGPTLPDQRTDSSAVFLHHLVVIAVVLAVVTCTLLRDVGIIPTGHVLCDKTEEK